MSDPILALSLVQKAFAASILLGVVCGILGTFVVVRRISLVGDAISHSVLPGVVIGFILSTQLDMERNPWIVLLCASISGLISMLIVRQIIATTRLKADAALGLCLSGLFGIGLAMESSLRPHIKNPAGIKSFIFGELATISDADLHAMAITSCVLIFVIVLLLRPLSLVSFDELYARSLGYPVKLLNLIFYTLLTVTIVVSLQAVGAILVSAMLIIPASTAYLLTERKSHMMLLSILIGGIAGGIGFWISAKVEEVNIQTGPVIALISAGFFTLAYLIAPRHGVIAKARKVIKRRQIIHRENTLKAIHKILEASNFENLKLTISQVATSRKLDEVQSKKDLQELSRINFLKWEKDKSTFTLSRDGYKRAQQLVRNHRLWELYLTKFADYQADHVHDDAEKIEHLLNEELVAQLDKELNFPEVDPHGMPIPRPTATN